jgi:hypothetical protein
VHIDDSNKLQSVLKHNLKLNDETERAKFMECMGENDCFDISDLCEIPDTIPEEIPGSSESKFNFNKFRPTSGDSTSSGESKISRPISSESSGSQFSDSSDFPLLWDKDWLISSYSNTSSTKSFNRPATAISIMRLPEGPMIILPKTRPATADNILAGILKISKETNESEPNTADSVKSTSNMWVSETELAYFNKPTDSGDTTNSITRLNPSKKHYQSERASKAKRPTATASSEELLSFSSQTKINSRNRKVPPKETAFLPKTSPRTIPQPTISANQRMICEVCHKKLGPAQIFTCKCDKKLCSTHRYSDRHTCSYDYKAEGRTILRRANPLVNGEKCLKL